MDGPNDKPVCLATSATNLRLREYNPLDYVLGDGAEQDIADALEHGELTPSQAGKLHSRVEEVRGHLAAGSATAGEAAHDIHSAIRDATKTEGEREADAIMSVLKRFRSARNAVHRLRTLDCSRHPRAVIAIAACVAEMVMTIQSTQAGISSGVEE